MFRAKTPKRQVGSSNLLMDASEKAFIYLRLHDFEGFLFYAFLKLFTYFILLTDFLASILSCISITYCQKLTN